MMNMLTINILVISALLLNIPVLFVLCVVFCLDGLVIFAVYADCDLVKEGKITRNDQVGSKADFWRYPSFL